MDEYAPFERRESDALVRRAFRKGLLVGCLVSVAIPILLGAIGAVTLGILIERGHVPDSAAVAGHELNARTLEFLRAEELVRGDEQIAYFYSAGLISLREDGNFFTDRRTVSYWEVADEIQIESAGYHEIETLSYTPDDSLFADSVITVERVDQTTFPLIVSNEGGKDDEFFELLDSAWKQHRNGEPARSGEELDDEVLDFLRGESIVEVDEQVLFFYAKTSDSLRVDGNLFTDRRVISYWESEDEIFTREALYPQIAGVEPSWEKGRHEVTTVSVELLEGDPFELWISPEDGGDRAFVRSLEATWKAKR